VPNITTIFDRSHSLTKRTIGQATSSEHLATPPLRSLLRRFGPRLPGSKPSTSQRETTSPKLQSIPASPENVERAQGNLKDTQETRAHSPLGTLELEHDRARDKEHGDRMRLIEKSREELRGQQQVNLRRLPVPPVSAEEHKANKMKEQNYLLGLTHGGVLSHAILPPTPPSPLPVDIVHDLGGPGKVKGPRKPAQRQAEERRGQGGGGNAALGE
jgi:hypothetical protein